MAEAISKAARRAVPLNSMCSMKWAAPLFRPFSWREPPSTQAPMETDRTWSISSDMTRMPLCRMVLLTIGSQCFLPAETDLTLLVHLQHLDHHLVPLAEDVGDLVHPLTGELRDVQKTLRSGQDLDEGAEIHDLLDRALVDLADLRVLGQPLHHGHGPGGRFRVAGGDGHRAVILYVDLDTRLRHDLADVLAAGTDHVAHLLRSDLDGGG